VIEEVREQWRRKELKGAALLEELARVRHKWPEIRDALSHVLIPSARISKALKDAGAPARPSKIGVDAARAVHTVRVCRQIRGRYVGLDLLDNLGKLHGWAAEVVDACESELVG
jgi:hypothetical protein